MPKEVAKKQRLEGGQAEWQHNRKGQAVKPQN